MQKIAFILAAILINNLYAFSQSKSEFTFSRFVSKNEPSKKLSVHGCMLENSDNIPFDTIATKKGEPLMVIGSKTEPFSYTDAVLAIQYLIEIKKPNNVYIVTKYEIDVSKNPFCPLQNGFLSVFYKNGKITVVNFTEDISLDNGDIFIIKK